MRNYSSEEEFNQARGRGRPAEPEPHRRDRGVLAVALIVFGLGVVIWLIWVLVTTMEPAMQMLLLGLLIGIVITALFASVNHIGLTRQVSQMRQDLETVGDRLERTRGLLGEANNVIGYMKMAAQQIRGGPGYIPQQMQQHMPQAYLQAPQGGYMPGPYGQPQGQMPAGYGQFPAAGAGQYGYQLPDADPFPHGQPNLPRGGQNGLNEFDVVERG